jgi:hypothetical protein
MHHATLLMLSVIAFTGCVSEQVTYERNLQPNHISLHAHLLSIEDRDQIARLMAHRTNQPIICLCAGAATKASSSFTQRTSEHTTVAITASP